MSTTDEPQSPQDDPNYVDEETGVDPETQRDEPISADPEKRQEAAEQALEEQGDSPSESE